MPLADGTRIGPYEILGPLGAGGMGEVYRARDGKLGRDVAMKVLPAALANDSGYMARFEREAQALAALNHPNIADLWSRRSRHRHGVGGGADTRRAHCGRRGSRGGGPSHRASDRRCPRSGARERDRASRP